MVERQGREGGERKGRGKGDWGRVREGLEYGTFSPLQKFLRAPMHAYRLPIYNHVWIPRSRYYKFPNPESGIEKNGSGIAMPIYKSKCIL